MKGLHLTSGYCLLFIALLSQQSQFSQAAYTMSETCAEMPKGYIADPEDCQSYGYCENGNLLGKKKCADGFLYDSRLGQCNYANKVKCSTNLESTCTYSENPMYVADPNDCSKACYCEGNGKYKCNSCPYEQLFNPQTKSCVWSKDYNCPADSICRLVTDNKFVADPEKCGNYISCFAGSGVSETCGDNLWFNPLTGNCENVNFCQDRPVTPAPGVGPGIDVNLLTNKTACADYNITPIPNKDQPYFYSDKTTCFGYYVCTSKEGPGTWVKCPMGTHFNEVLQQCVTPYTFKCEKDRCGNINQRYVCDISSPGCSSYLYCEHQTTKKEYSQSCEASNSKFPYFDERLGSCVNSEPDYAICKP